MAKVYQLLDSGFPCALIGSEQLLILSPQGHSTEALGFAILGMAADPRPFPIAPLIVHLEMGEGIRDQLSFCDLFKAYEAYLER
jgi:hypothetical protein